MKVIITGGTGLIGSALAHSLVEDGHEVVILTRDPSRESPQLPPEARRVGWDAKTGEGWSDEAEGADAIVNLAGETIGPEGGFWSAERRRRIIQSRVNAGSAVVDALRRVTSRPRVLVQMSGIGYYGPRGDEPLTEDAASGDDFLAEVVRAWEASSAPAEALGVRRVITRTGIVLANEGTLDLFKLPVKLFVGGPLGNGKQVVSWIHLADEVRAIRFLIENEATSGPYNLTAPNPLSNKEFIRTLGRVMGRPAFFPTPGFAVRLALGSMATMALDGQRAVPARLSDAGFDFHFPNLEGALRDLLAKPASTGRRFALPRRRR